MRILVVYCHPCEDSFNASVLKVTRDALAERGHEFRVCDLYREGFDPVMRAPEWKTYHDPERNLEPVSEQVERLKWAEAVVFIYPTWWYGPPAMLKGWLERVLVPGFAFEVPTAKRGPVPKLKHITRVIVLTTCGATPFLSWVMGQPGRRILLRGFRSICSTFCRTSYLALYRMDSASPSERASHLLRVRGKILSLM
jgi:putative NADPH-quinone reductase